MVTLMAMLVVIWVVLGKLMNVENEWSDSTDASKAERL